MRIPKLEDYQRLNLYNVSTLLKLSFVDLHIFSNVVYIVLSTSFPERGSSLQVFSAIGHFSRIIFE